MMYTVVRFTARSLPKQELELLGVAIGEVLPGAYTGLRHAGDGFACDVATDGDWEYHQAEIAKFIRASTSVISRAHEQGVQVCVDVAIEPDDIDGTNVFSICIEPEVTKLLSDLDVIMSLSIYGGSGDSPLGGQ